jgi:hypothetical protein
LPAVAAQVGERSSLLVFVDAGLPPCDGRTTASAEFLDRLRGLAVEGVLPKWSAWWGEDVMQALVPDIHRRDELEAELPEIPLAFFESAIDVPDGWCQRDGAYLLLSESYRTDAERAGALGWPVVERLGAHLDLVNDSEEISRIIIDFAS